MLEFLRRQQAAPQQTAFRPPDPGLAISYDEPQPVQVSRVKLTAADEIAADEYLSASAQAKKFTDRAEKAKEHLKRALGDASSGLLPDGRVVSKTVQSVPERVQTVKAHNRTTITIA